MANSGKDATHLQYTSSDVARLRNGAQIPAGASTAAGPIARHLSMRQTNKMYRAEHDALATKVFVSILAIVVISFFSLCFTGAMGQYYPYTEAYTYYTPMQVVSALGEHAYNLIGSATGWWGVHSNEYILENVPGYWSIATRVGVVGITILCSILLAVSGMLYQNVFHNPIAGPGMLGVGSGVSIGVMILVALYSGAATSMTAERYGLCYGFGAAILIFVILAGKKLSGPGKPFDIITMLLVGSVLSQFLGFITQFVTLFLMDESDYLTFYTISQMLTVNTSGVSWIALGTATVLSLVPVIVMRYKLNVLSFDAMEARLLGLNATSMRALALICGAIMILAAQIHIGGVANISLIVPFIARSLFGCEFNKQLIGNLCLSPIVVLICRDVTDAIPFIADGLSMASVAGVILMPLFVIIMSKNMRGWE